MKMRPADLDASASDSAMPSLARALDSDLAEPALQLALRLWRRDIADVELRGTRLLRHKPGRRALIEYQVSFTGAEGDESIALIGKIRAKGLDTKTSAVMTQLYRAGFEADSADGISVPEVNGEVPELQMWLQQKVPGTSLTDWPAGAGGAALALRVAEAACKLHRARVQPPRRHTVDDELQILRERFDRLSSRRPEIGRRLNRLLAACVDLAGPLRHRPTCGIHRDFYPAQILADGDRLWLLDFDLFCEGDPALDIGNFLGHLTEHALREYGDAESLMDSERVLESRFVELTGEDSRAAIRAWHTLTLARHVSISTQFPERQPFTEALLALCESRLRKSRETNPHACGQ